MPTLREKYDRGGFLNNLKAQEQKMEILKQQGLNDLAVQNAANKGGINVARIRQNAATERANAVNRLNEIENESLAKSNEQTLAAQKKRDWMNVFTKLTSKGYDKEGNELPGMSHEDAIKFMNNTETAYDNYLNPTNTQRPRGVVEVLGGRGRGDIYSVGDTIKKTNPLQRATNRMNKRFDNMEELRKKSPFLKRSNVFNRRQDIGNRLFTLKG